MVPPDELLEMHMLDVFFLAVGVGTLAVLGLYARALARL